MDNELRRSSSKPIATWLLTGVAMLMVQILLGGITRLTGSGLSITEWNVVTGTLPPLNEQQWLAEFEKYRQTPQFHLLNSDFTLKDFKFIFFWEWLHRFWARLIGVVFAIPFIIFLLQKRFRPRMIKPMLILFLLGALQGTIGWIMVASGLTGDAIYVKPAKLALHFIFALGLLCYTFWFALELIVSHEKKVFNPSARKLNIVVIVLMGLQLIFGALMAGLKAASAAPTWPDINGRFVPQGMWNSETGLLNLVDNKISIHFIHRGLAYLLLVLILLLTTRLYKTKGDSLFRRTRWLSLFFVLLQAILGILAVLSSTKIVPNHWGEFEWMAQFHQLIAMCLLLSTVWILFMTNTKNDPKIKSIQIE